MYLGFTHTVPAEMEEYTSRLVSTPKETEIELQRSRSAAAKPKGANVEQIPFAENKKETPAPPGSDSSVRSKPAAHFLPHSAQHSSISI